MKGSRVEKVENTFTVRTKDGADTTITAGRLEVGPAGELNIIEVHVAGWASSYYTIGSIAPGEWTAWRTEE